MSDTVSNGTENRSPDSHVGNAKLFFPGQAMAEDTLDVIGSSFGIRENLLVEDINHAHAVVYKTNSRFRCQTMSYIFHSKNRVVGLGAYNQVLNGTRFFRAEERRLFPAWTSVVLRRRRVPSSIVVHHFNIEALLYVVHAMGTHGDAFLALTVGIVEEFIVHAQGDGRWGASSSQGVSDE